MPRPAAFRPNPERPLSPTHPPIHLNPTHPTPNPPPPPSYESKYAREVEVTNGRAAMVGFLAAVMVEAATGHGIILQVGRAPRRFAPFEWLMWDFVG